MGWGHQVKNHPESALWDVASLTKVMATWPHCGSLIQDGFLGFGTRLEELFDDSELPGGEIRIVDLLTHTSGLLRRTRLDLYDEYQRRDLARTMLAQGLVGLPGLEVCYISRGFILLGLIIEKRFADNFERGVREGRTGHRLANGLPSRSASSNEECCVDRRPATRRLRSNA